MATPLSPSAPLLPLLISFSLALCLAQQDSTGPEPPRPSEPYLNGSFNSSTAIIIVILISAFFFLAFFSIYLRQCGSREEGAAQNRGWTMGVRSRRASTGLDASVIEGFPTLVYSDVKEHKIGKGALECAVCLCEFEDDETLRLLPTCDHVFHPECIDTWLSTRTTCPVCRANLAAVDAPGTTPPVDVPLSPPTPPAADAIVDVPDDRDHVEVPVAEPETTAEGERRPEVDPGLGRTGSRKSGRLLRMWRSRSARPAPMGRWAEEDRDRFTLRLPDHVRREVLAGKLNRSVSISAFRGGEESLRRGYRREGSSRRGGRSLRMGGRLDWVTGSDRWAFLSRPLSFKLNRNGGDGEGPSVKREGSTRKVGGGDGEGSMKGKVFARVPLDCLGAGGVEDDAGGEEGVGVPVSKV